MDTPDNSNPKPSSSFLSKFEDSPVFNYISTLSPIKQFSLNHSAPSFRLLSFTSPVQLESLQTPPPITCPQEPNVQSANHDTGASMNNSAQDATEGRNADPSKVVQPCESRVEKSDKLNTRREVYITTNEPSKLANVIRRVKHECVSPESNAVCSRVAKLDFEFCGVKTTESISSKVVQENQDNPKEAEVLPKLEISTNVEDNKEVCEWEKFIHETCDIFGSHSPTQETHNEDQCDVNDDSETFSFIGEFLQMPSEYINGSQKVDPSCPCESIENHEGATRRDETTQTSQVSSLRAHTVLAEEAVNYAKTDVDEKPATQQQQTASRRCLVYEVSGSHYRKLLSEATGSSPASNLAASTTTSNEQRIASSKRGSNKFSSALPGIGLHLNALASTGREKIIVKRESLTCRRQLISVPGTASSFDPLKPDVEILKPPSGTETVGRVSDMQKDETCLNENTSENSAFGEDIGLPPGSPQKKRKNPDTVGESDSCKRCNCKRSKCLKLYCDCFAAGLYCVEPCNCQGCFNKPAHEDMVLETRRQIESRNPLAFAPKVVICSSTPIKANEMNKTPASARHKRGCNCKKSGCLKKYCECFQGGVGCSPSCRCEGCKNTFGRKKGFEGIVFEEAKILHKSAPSVTLHDEVLKTDHENQEIPELPDKERQPPEFTLRPCGKSLESSTSQKIDNSNVTNIAEKDEPANDYLIPTTTVKSTSPNCKRISSHHHDSEPSPAWKSSRKLILRAVPSFSTVPKQQESSELQEIRQ